MPFFNTSAPLFYFNDAEFERRSRNLFIGKLAGFARNSGDLGDQTTVAGLKRHTAALRLADIHSKLLCNRLEREFPCEGFATFSTSGPFKNSAAS